MTSKRGGGWAREGSATTAGIPFNTNRQEARRARIKVRSEVDGGVRPRRRQMPMWRWATGPKVHSPTPKARNSSDNRGVRNTRHENEAEQESNLQSFKNKNIGRQQTRTDR